jgi:RNA polymerase sigma factor for flagellar operon FliA
MEAQGADEAELWRRSKRGCRDAAAQLTNRYAPWATAIARSIYRRVPAYPVDCEDFVQNAHVGLLEAIERFEPERGIPFQAFAKPRVRGAVFNGIRTIFGDRAGGAHEARLSERLESLQEPAGGDPLEPLVQSIVGLALGYMLDDAAQVQNAGPLAYAQTHEQHQRLRVAVGGLPARLRDIIEGHYFRFVPFVDMASAAGLTKGRISQLHREALHALRAQLSDGG